MQHYNTVYVCFRAGNKVSHKKLQMWLVSCTEVVLGCIHHMESFSRRKNTHIFSFVLFVLLQ